MAAGFRPNTIGAGQKQRRHDVVALSLIIHDITERKRFGNGNKKPNEELERRVVERTAQPGHGQKTRKPKFVREKSWRRS